MNRSMAGLGLGGFLVDVTIVGDLLDHEVTLPLRHMVEALPQPKDLTGTQGTEGADHSPVRGHRQAGDVHQGAGEDGLPLVPSVREGQPGLLLPRRKSGRQKLPGLPAIPLYKNRNTGLSSGLSDGHPGRDELLPLPLSPPYPRTLCELFLPHTRGFAPGLGISSVWIPPPSRRSLPVSRFSAWCALP